MYNRLKKILVSNIKNITFIKKTNIIHIILALR